MSTTAPADDQVDLVKPLRHFERHAVRKTFSPDTGRTKQEFKDDCDINKILERFTKTGQLPPPRSIEQYGDFSSVGSYFEAHVSIMNADQIFLQLPSAVRKEFNNDAGTFLGFLEDPDNREEAIEMGLLPPDPVEASPAQPAAPKPQPPPGETPPTPEPPE